MQVSGADGQVVDRHDPAQPLAVDHGEPADPVLDHEGHRLLEVHLDLACDDRPRRVLARRGLRADAVGHHGEGEVTVGDHPERLAAIRDHDRADVAVAHELADVLERVAGVGGHHALGHDLGDPHAERDNIGSSPTLDICPLKTHSAASSAIRTSSAGAWRSSHSRCRERNGWPGPTTRSSWPST
jgi:hypothetical protein